MRSSCRFRKLKKHVARFAANHHRIQKDRHDETVGRPIHPRLPQFALCRAGVAGLEQGRAEMGADLSALGRESYRIAHLNQRPELGALRRFFKRGEALKVDPMAAQEAAGGLFAREAPTKEQFRADLDGLLARGVKLFFAYFGLETGITHESQFIEMTGLQPSDQLRLLYMGGADHILYRTADRTLALGAVAQWMKESFTP